MLKDGKHGKNQLQIHRERLRTREAATMASQNGLTNGHNGTTVVPEVEQEVQQLEVKSIQNISIQSDSVQDEILKPETPQDVAGATIQNVTVQEDVLKPEIQQDVARIQAEINHPDIIQPVVQEPATPKVDEIVTLPVEVNVKAAVVETPQEVAVAVTKEASGKSVNDASPQPQVIVETPTITQEVKVVSAPTNVVVPGDQSIVVPGIQPGTSDFQVPQYAITAINRIAQDEGFTNYAINYDRGSNFGDGFVAEIVRAKIKGLQLVKGVQEESELVLMVKLPPDNKTRREQMGMNVFEREVTVYNEILPMFKKFQVDKGLKPGQGFVSFPKCYFASFDKEKDESVIIMEDIRKKGFKMLSKYKYVDYPHAAAVLETIAQFHGLSLAMKDQCPGLFDKFKGLKDAMTDGMLTEMMKSMTTASCEKAIETLEPHEENIKLKLRAFGENVIDVIKTCTNGELSEPYTVINHGDCWVNNMMFKYERGIPRHICLLDWQISRYASPVLDICYFLFQCTDSELRAQHFDNLIQGYHIALRKQVELLGSDVNQILPFTALLREMKSKAKFALSTALFVIPMLCMPNAELPNMDDMVESMVKGDVSDEGMFQMSANTEPLYKKRMGGILRDMYKKGYL